MSACNGLIYAPPFRISAVGLEGARTSALPHAPNTERRRSSQSFRETGITSRRLPPASSDAPSIRQIDRREKPTRAELQKGIIAGVKAAAQSAAAAQPALQARPELDRSALGQRAGAHLGLQQQYGLAIRLLEAHEAAAMRTPSPARAPDDRGAGCRRSSFPERCRRRGGRSSRPMVGPQPLDKCGNGRASVRRMGAFTATREEPWYTVRRRRP
jgi:hypothetical protein